MLRLLVIGVLLWLTLLTILTLVALFRHSTSTHVGQRVIVSRR